jgi:hypothetical protein
MPGKLEVSFNSPQCGWMSIGFSAGGNEFHTTTAHAPHALALTELLRILTALLDAKSTPNEHLLKWSRDPEEFDFQFVRNGGEVEIEIYQYPTDERESATRELVFSHKGTVMEVCEAFATTFEQLYTDRDTDEFEFNWRQPFPIADFDRFETKMAEVLIK